MPTLMFIFLSYILLIGVCEQDELRMLSAQMVRLSMQKLPFERLSVPVDVALQMFTANEYKRAQIPLIAESENSKWNLILYFMEVYSVKNCYFRFTYCFSI